MYLNRYYYPTLSYVNITILFYLFYSNQFQYTLQYYDILNKIINH